MGIQKRKAKRIKDDDRKNLIKGNKNFSDEEKEMLDLIADMIAAIIIKETDVENDT